jgi:hypothetical protein
MVLTLASFQVELQRNIAPAQTVGCLRDRPSGAKALEKNLKELRTGSIQCGQQPHADLEWIQGPEGQAGGGHTCVGFEKVCVDQGAIVMHSDRYVVNGTHFNMPTFDITDLIVCPYTCCLGIFKDYGLPCTGCMFQRGVTRGSRGRYHCLSCFCACALKAPTAHVPDSVPKHRWCKLISPVSVSIMHTQ